VGVPENRPKSGGGEKESKLGKGKGRKRRGGQKRKRFSIRGVEGNAREGGVNGDGKLKKAKQVEAGKGWSMGGNGASWETPEGE